MKVKNTVSEGGPAKTETATRVDFNKAVDRFLAGL